MVGCQWMAVNGTVIVGAVFYNVCVVYLIFYKCRAFCLGITGIVLMALMWVDESQVGIAKGRLVSERRASRWLKRFREH